MKGIILAGGAGTRLYPLTKTISKQLLPVYDKQMVYYPLSTMISFGIRDILIISTPTDTPNVEKLFGNGADLGMSIQYKIQPKPKGLAQAFTIGEEFINGQPVGMVLGDNIFHIPHEFDGFKRQVTKNQNKNATIFGYPVLDPQRFGVIEFDEKTNKVLSIEEKPEHPKSNYAAVGLYFYPGDVSQKAHSLKPSKRGELEITDLNNLYRVENRLNVVQMNELNAWKDAGTFASLHAAGDYVKDLFENTGYNLGCIEEAALRSGFIDVRDMEKIISKLDEKSDYCKYLIKVCQEYTK